jgi:site-specific recombinase XerC
VPPEREWFQNLTNAHTRRAYENVVGDFMHFAGIERPEEFRTVTRAHIIAWRDDMRIRLTRRGQPWGDASIRHRLAALASLFEYLCERNAVTHNPVKGAAHPGTQGHIHDYLDAAGHGTDEHGALFRPVRNNTTGELAY